MYRGKDDQGEIQGGVMYYIEQGLGKKYRPLSLMFGLSGMIGCTIFFQANQLSQIIREYFYNPTGLFQSNILFGDLFTGFLVASLVSVVIFGGVYWSKFAHMFYKPGAAIQKNLAEADGSRDNLPPEADAPEQFGLGIKREEPKHY